MITVRNLDDINHTTIVDIKRAADDGKSAWNLSLKTVDLPPIFENSNNRLVELSIIDAKDINAGTPNVMFIPVVLSGIVFMDDQMKRYYRQRYSDTSTLSPSLTLDGFVILDNAEGAMLEDAYLRIEFKVMATTNGDQSATRSGQTFTGNFSGMTSEEIRDRIHVDANESSMGGVTLPLGSTSADAEAVVRESQAA